jgi:hypothetical protein
MQEFAGVLFTDADPVNKMYATYLHNGIQPTTEARLSNEGSYAYSTV